MATRNIAPRADGEGKLGTADLNWAEVNAKKINGDTFSGNAATASALATARTIELSGNATGSASFDGTKDINIIVTVDERASCPDGAAAHNARPCGGKDLTSYFTSGEMSEAIADGTFKDIFPGDYITKSVTINGTTYSNKKHLIGGCNTLIRMNGLTTNHVIVFPDTPYFSAVMNGTSTTTGGYAGSKMWGTTIPLVNTGVTNAFGSAHIVTHKELLSKEVDTNLASMAGCGWTGAVVDNWSTWYDVTCNLFNEMMVYGSLIFTSSAGEARSNPVQVPLFKHDADALMAYGNHYWLRAVVYSTYFADVNGANGSANNHGAADSRGVRPYFLLR